VTEHNKQLTDEEARTIRDLYADDVTQAALALEYSVSPGTISNVVRGNTYPDAGGPIVEGKPRGRVLTAQDAKRIRESHVNDNTPIADLSAKYGTSRANIQHILVGRTWPNAGGPIPRLAPRKES
jgi:hypothetical protein